GPNLLRPCLPTGPTDAPATRPIPRSTGVREGPVEPAPIPTCQPSSDDDRESPLPPIRQRKPAVCELSPGTGKVVLGRCGAAVFNRLTPTTPTSRIRAVLARGVSFSVQTLRRVDALRFAPSRSFVERPGLSGERIVRLPDGAPLDRRRRRGAAEPPAE